MLLLLLIGNTLLVRAEEGAQTKRSYRIERQLGVEGEWKEITSFVLHKPSEGFSPRIRSSSTPRVPLSTEERQKFGVEDFLFYRVVDPSAPNVEVARVAVSPCTIIRGFQAMDKSLLRLSEKLSVVADGALNVVGLQVHSKTNIFHSSMVKGDVCERSVVTSLFAEVEIEPELSLVEPLDVAGVRYEELKRLSGEVYQRKNKNGEPSKEGMKRPEKMSVLDDYEDEEDEEATEPQEKSFFQQYWYVFAAVFFISMLRSGKEAAAKAQKPS